MDIDGDSIFSELTWLNGVFQLHGADRGGSAKYGAKVMRAELLTTVRKRAPRFARYAFPSV